MLGEEEFEADGGPFDVVTCMFAMHYFFESERKLRMFVRNVSRNLKPGAWWLVLAFAWRALERDGHRNRRVGRDLDLHGWRLLQSAGGVFIGTIPDGKRILWHLGGKAQFNTKHLKLEKRWEVRVRRRWALGCFGVRAAATAAALHGQGGGVQSDAAWLALLACSAGRPSQAAGVWQRVPVGPARHGHCQCVRLCTRGPTPPAAAGRRVWARVCCVNARRAQAWTSAARGLSSSSPSRSPSRASPRTTTCCPC